MKATPIFAHICAASGIPAPVCEFRFHPVRRWRFDYAWPAQQVALEVEGAVWTGGRHTRGSGFVRDCEKYNTATAAGWRILRVQPRELMSAATIKHVALAIALAVPAPSGRARPD